MTGAAEKVNLLGMPKAKLEAFFESLGEKRFRATQVLQWIHQRGADDFDQTPEDWFFQRPLSFHNLDQITNSEATRWSPPINAISPAGRSRCH